MFNLEVAMDKDLKDVEARIDELLAETKKEMLEIIYSSKKSKTSKK